MCSCPTSGKIPSYIEACRSICSAPRCACCAIRSKLSETGWLYEASIITPGRTEKPVCLRVRRCTQGTADRPRRLRARGLQRLFPQDQEIPGGGRRAWRPSWSAGSAGNRASRPATREQHDLAVVARGHRRSCSSSPWGAGCISSSGCSSPAGLPAPLDRPARTERSIPRPSMPGSTPWACRRLDRPRE